MLRKCDSHTEKNGNRFPGGASLSAGFCGIPHDCQIHVYDSFVVKSHDVVLCAALAL